MAASPEGVQPVLDYEREEAVIGGAAGERARTARRGALRASPRAKRSIGVRRVRRDAPRGLETSALRSAREGVRLVADGVACELERPPAQVLDGPSLREERGHVEDLRRRPLKFASYA